MKKTELVALSGSIRSASFNTSVLKALQASASDGINITILSIKELPHYNQDEDGPHAPDVVQNFKSAIANADGLIVCSPEYSAGMPGVLKNALDWAARPANASPLKGKPVLIMSASPSFTGGARAQSQLLQTFTSTLSRVVPYAPIVIAAVHTKLKDGEFVDPDNIKFAQEGINELVREINSRQLK